MQSWWWRTSTGLNLMLCGSAHEPLCSRAHRLGWHRFIECMAILFRDPVHAESVHARWQEMRKPRQMKGREMKANFERCLEFVLRHEGGYVNDKRDPGGETNFGISKRSYPGENIKAMTRERAAAIYRRDFWNAVRGDDLAAGLDLVAFDAAVNSGSSRGARWLQEAIGVKADGVIGPQTIARAHEVAPVTAINRACDARMAFLRGLGTWGTFGRGWTTRVEGVRSTASGMVKAYEAPAQPSPPKSNPLAALFAWLSRILKG